MCISNLRPLPYAFESWVVLRRFETGWLNLETKPRCPDFGLHARAGILTLERALRCCLSARAGFLTLERSFPSSNISSAELYARAGVMMLEWVVVCDARAGGLTLERRPGSVKVLEVCIRRSSGIVDARAGVCE